MGGKSWKTCDPVSGGLCRCFLWYYISSIKVVLVLVFKFTYVLEERASIFTERDIFQKTRIGMTINDLRKKTSDEHIAKRAKTLIKVRTCSNSMFVISKLKVFIAFETPNTLSLSKLEHLHRSTTFSDGSAFSYVI